MTRPQSSPDGRAPSDAGATAALELPGTIRPQPHPAQQVAVALRALAVVRAPTAPDDPLWRDAPSARIPLNPQDLVLPRLREAGAKAVHVRVLYDADRLGFLIEWPDAHPDTDLGTVLQYRDAVAIQFPEDPTVASPSYMMGAKGGAVVIYHWKSDWQFGQLRDVDEAYPNMYADWYPYSGAEPGKIPEAMDYLVSGHKEYLTAAAAGNALADPEFQQQIGPVQKMYAEGFGTLEPSHKQDAQGQGVWRDGTWRIVISIPRQQAFFKFTEGSPIPLAFAVWDGSRNERNGQKAYSVWHTLTLGRNAPGAMPWPYQVFAATLMSISLLLTTLAGVLGWREWWLQRRKQS